jgi:primosomal protein N' (replication factor Y)
MFFKEQQVQEKLWFILKLLKDIINKGFQGLILLPEIGLTGQFEKKFIEFFGFTPAVWHSGISKKKKKLFGVELQMEKLKLS